MDQDRFAIYHEKWDGVYDVSFFESEMEATKEFFRLAQDRTVYRVDFQHLESGDWEPAIEFKRNVSVLNG